MRIIEKAIETSAIAHDGQYRKRSKLPYLSHPVTVGFYLIEAGAEEKVITAGILHDVLEDTSISFNELESEFGIEIANLVLGCSEPDKSLPWEDRKRHTIEKLKTASYSIKQIACADKLHNLTTILYDYEQEGKLVWQRFNRGRDQQRWYYESIYESLMTNLSTEEAANPLFNKLKNQTHRVFSS
ncbi:HD domain-containing protein [Pseudalkalibacillus hwajinpoensis]|uniref:HD domain-containing protein n=1 Tax=Guptibacillus hwajinpoensis TaxID=208199 RepID=UPI00325BEA2A